jgi:hypothetical protein
LEELVVGRIAARRDGDVCSLDDFAAENKKVQDWSGIDRGKVIRQFHEDPVILFEDGGRIN